MLDKSATNRIGNDKRTMDQPEPLKSTLLDDPVFGDLVKEFLIELRRDLLQLQALVRADEVSELAERMHQLKGSAGMHGLPMISEAADETRKLLLADVSPQERDASVGAFVDLCRRVLDAHSF